MLYARSLMRRGWGLKGRKREKKDDGKDNGAHKKDDQSNGKNKEK